MHFVNECSCYTSEMAGYKRNVLITLEKFQVMSYFDETDPQSWFEIMMGDLSSLPSHYHLGGENEGCALELYRLSLGYLEEIETLRNTKLESLGLDRKGLHSLPPGVKDIFNGFKLVCDLTCPLPVGCGLTGV